MLRAEHGGGDVIATSTGVQAYLESVQNGIIGVETVAVQALADAVATRYQSNRSVFVIGNGGSAAAASHFSSDLRLAAARAERPSIKALSLTDNLPYILALANDTSFESIFVEQLKGMATPGDLLVAISVSGNSPNVVAAVNWANHHDIDTFGIAGTRRCHLVRASQRSIVSEHSDPGIVESVQLAVLHAVRHELEARLSRRSSWT